MELLLHLIGGIAASVFVAIGVYKVHSRVVVIASIAVLSVIYIVLSYTVAEIVGLQFVLAGVLFGFIAKNFSFQRYFVLSVLMLWFLLLVVYYLQYYIKGIDVIADNQKLIQEMIEGSSLGVAEKSVLTQQLQDFLPTMRMLVPFSYFISAIVISLFIYTIVFAFFIRFNFLKSTDSTFSLFHVNEWVVFVLIASWATVLFVTSEYRIWAVALNIGLILVVVYTIQGLAIVNYYFEKKQWPKLYGMAVLLIGMLLGFQVLFFIITMLMGLGVIDFWMNFRKTV